VRNNCKKKKLLCRSEGLGEPRGQRQLNASARGFLGCWWTAFKSFQDLGTMRMVALLSGSFQNSCEAAREVGSDQEHGCFVRVRGCRSPRAKASRCMESPLERLNLAEPREPLKMPLKSGSEGEAARDRNPMLTAKSTGTGQ